MNTLALAIMEDAEPKNDAERDALERNWFDEKRGMWRDGDALLRFVRRHRADILREAGTCSTDEELIRTVKIAILRVRSLSMSAELKAQMREIEKELWIQGAHTPEDVMRIKFEWTRDHAENWRKWRVKEYIYLVDRFSSRVLHALRDTAQ
ncbi:MAG: hypothetical protein Q8N18_07190 [Opitutaceae bacterium]|nr:hypothetical protein [Opitutaceae bacterium]